jgi:putative transposase
MMEENEGRPMGQVIKIDEARIRDHLGEMVRGTVEQTLNAMRDTEADELCGAARYQRSAERVDTRAGSYDRTLHPSAGEVKLKVPKLRQQVFETAIIERYRRREASVEESLIEMYLAGVSVDFAPEAAATAEARKAEGRSHVPSPLALRCQGTPSFTS